MSVTHSHIFCTGDRITASLAACREPPLFRLSNHEPADISVWNSKVIFPQNLWCGLTGETSGCHHESLWSTLEFAFCLLLISSHTKPPQTRFFLNMKLWRKSDFYRLLIILILASSHYFPVLEDRSWMQRAENDDENREATAHPPLVCVECVKIKENFIWWLTLNITQLCNYWEEFSIVV